MANFKMFKLKNGHEVSHKKFVGPIFAWQGLSSSFGHNPSFYDVPKPKSGIFPIFVKKCTIKIDLNLDCGPEFSL